MSPANVNDKNVRITSRNLLHRSVKSHLIFECNDVIVVFRFKNKYPQQWLSFRAKFEVAKKAAKPDGESCILLQMPLTLGEIYEEKIQIDRNNGVLLIKCEALGVEVYNGTITISNKAVSQMFEPVVQEIAEFVRQVLEEPKLAGCDFVLLVGGFSESKFLQEAVRAKKPDSVALLVPNDAQLCVVKGAIMFGHHPELVTSRIARFTYATDVVMEFKPGFHQERNSLVLNQVKYCDVLDTIVLKGEVIETGSVKTTMSYPVELQQKSVDMTFYAIDGIPDNPQYADDPRVWELDTGLTLAIPDTTGELAREIKTLYYFGGTEIRVEAFDETAGNEAKCKINLQFE